MKMLKIEEIKMAFNSIGVTSRDIIVLQSSYKGCGEIEKGPEGLIETLIDILGDQGTLLMPTYNFEMWTQRGCFDIKETPSEVGVISEVFRKREDVGRTIHPIHSLAVWGKYKEEFESMRYCNSFGKDSIFSRLKKYNALYITIGLGDKMPFLPCHYTENIMNVSYRKIKNFSGIYTHLDRVPKIKTYSFPVRLNDKNPVYGVHQSLVYQKEVNTYNKNNILLCYARAKDYHDMFVNYIKKNSELFSL